MLKALSALVLALSFSSAQAAPTLPPAPKKLTCRSLESNPFFQNLSITVGLPDDKDGTIMPGDWYSQTVSISYENEAPVRVSMLLSDDLAAQNLRGSFDLGGDFGSASFSLYWDNDETEVIAVASVSTDGPITAEVYRCR